MAVGRYSDSGLVGPLDATMSGYPPGLIAYYVRAMGLLSTLHHHQTPYGATKQKARLGGPRSYCTV